MPNVTDNCGCKSTEHEQLLLMGLCSRLNTVGKDSENSRTTVDSESDTGNNSPCIHSAGTALFQGADVSYI